MNCQIGANALTPMTVEAKSFPSQISPEMVSVY